MRAEWQLMMAFQARPTLRSGPFLAWPATYPRRLWHKTPS
jgi:glycine/sarcosine N-methyltransferase